MNLLVALVILICLAVGEGSLANLPPADSPNLGLRLTLIALATFLVPGLAWVQVSWVANRSQPASEAQKETSILRLIHAHTAVWLVVSLATILAFRWQEIVRVQWGLASCFLLDELLILAPILLSLIASWAIFYDVQREASTSCGPGRLHADSLSLARFGPQGWLDRWYRFIEWTQDRSRWSFLRTRIELQILVVLIPVMPVVALNDLRAIIQLEPSLAAIPAVVGVLLGLLAFSFVIKHFALRSTPLEPAIASRMEQELAQHNLSVHEVGRWQTGNQVINAFVQSSWGFRRVLISDLMLDEFPERETLAVIRHEAGHLQLQHSMQRLLFSLIPLLAVVLAGVMTMGSPMFLEQLADKLQFDVAWGYGSFLVFFVIYWLVAIRWLSHSMEFECDLFACCTIEPVEHAGVGDEGRNHPQPKQNRLFFSPRLASELAEALLRMAAYHQSHFEAATLFHPSLKARIEVLHQRIDAATRIVQQRLVALDWNPESAAPPSQLSAHSDAKECNHLKAAGRKQSRSGGHCIDQEDAYATFARLRYRRLGIGAWLLLVSTGLFALLGLAARLT